MEITGSGDRDSSGVQSQIAWQKFGDKALRKLISFAFLAERRNCRYESLRSRRHDRELTQKDV